MEQVGVKRARPHEVIAQRVRDLRKRHGWSAERLAAEMQRVGVPWSRIVVAKLENGKRPGVSVQELLALAFVLDVAPLHLVVDPADSEEFYAVTPEDWTPAIEAREWIRGRSPMPTQDARFYFSEVPEVEWEPPKEFPTLPSRRGDDGERQ